MAAIAAKSGTTSYRVWCSKSFTGRLDWMMKWFDAFFYFLWQSFFEYEKTDGKKSNNWQTEEICLLNWVCVSLIRKYSDLPLFSLLDKHFVVLGRLLVLGFSCTLARRCSTELCTWGDLPLPLALSRFCGPQTHTHTNTPPHTCGASR